MRAGAVIRSNTVLTNYTSIIIKTLLLRFSDSALNNSDENLYAHRRKGSSSSSSSSPSHMLHMSASNPDLSSLGVSDDVRSDYPEHVLKIYKADQSFKFLLVHRVSVAYVCMIKVLSHQFVSILFAKMTTIRTMGFSFSKNIQTAFSLLMIVVQYKILV